MVRYQDLAGLALVFITVGIALGIGSEVLEKTGESFDTATVTNESTTFVNNTYKALKNAPIVSVSELNNYTMTLPSDQYSINTDEQTMKLVLNASYPDSLTWNVSYSHRNLAAYRAVYNATEGEGELGNWLPTIALVLAAAMVIGLIFTAWRGKGRV